MFVCLEGIDGAGKTTQTRLLVSALNDAGRPAIQVADPGTTALGKAVREFVIDSDAPITPLAQMLLFSAARAELSQFIREKLAEGVIVVCDRWILSTLVYQCDGNNIAPELVLNVFRATSIVPNLCIVLDLSPDSAEKRRAPAKDRFESRPIEEKRQMRQAYLDYAQTVGECAKYTYVLDADVPREDMQQTIFTLVEQVATLNTGKRYAENGIG